MRLSTDTREAPSVLGIGVAFMAALVAPTAAAGGRPMSGCAAVGSTKQWTRGKNMLRKRAEHGNGKSSPRGQKAIYRSSGGSWSKFIDLPASLVSTGASFLSGTIHVHGGGLDNHLEGDMNATWARCVE